MTRLRQTAGLSDAGRVRRRNEDAFLCAPPLFAVADGMGGAQAGEVASRLATAVLRDYEGVEGVDAEARLRSIVQEANRRIYARAASDPHASGMGTTVTAVLLEDETVAVAHVGDSRVYRIRNGRLEQLTQDHSLVADLVRSGRLTPEEADAHPQRSVITRALGTDPAVVVDSLTTDARPGDVFLLCSDGLTGMVGDEAVLETVRRYADLRATARALVEAANGAGGEDNITVVLFGLEEGTGDDTLSRFEIVQPAETVPPPRSQETAPAAEAARGRRSPARPSTVGRAVLLVAVVVLLFAALAALALFGLSRAHFVGADADGRVAVYEGVPWEVLGVSLYRELYVSSLLAVQLSQEERAELFDHSLIGEAKARELVARFEQEAAP